MLTVSSIIAVPAIGAHPKETWTPRYLQGPHEPTIRRTEPLSTASLPTALKECKGQGFAPESTATEVSQKPSPSPQELDEKTSGISHRPWLTNGLRERIPQARVLLYDHGRLDEGDTLDVLAGRLLEQICQARDYKQNSSGQPSSRRPVFLVCHSTGGLVAKAALVIANQTEHLATVADNMHG